MKQHRLRTRLRKLFGIGKRPKSHRDLRERCTHVYRGKTWKSQESASGPGSELSSGQVRQAMIALTEVIHQHDIRSIADIPCGDFNWMPRFLDANPQVDYTGFDIVAPMIARNRRAHPGRRFEGLDITAQIPPPADLIFCKDLLNHLLETDVWAALANMVRSGSTYVMLTSNRGWENTELPENVAGSSRPLNLATTPYNLPEAIYDDGCLAMWRTADLRWITSR